MFARGRRGRAGEREVVWMERAVGVVDAVGAAGAGAAWCPVCVIG